MRKRLSEADVINKWLGDYHNTSIEKIFQERPEWSDGDHSREFYKEYSVTQEQHDEWHKWMIEAVAKDFRCSKKWAEKHSWPIYLQCSPTVKKEE